MILKNKDLSVASRRLVRVKNEHVAVQRGEVRVRCGEASATRRAWCFAGPKVSPCVRK